jgi:ribosomal protein L33
MDNDRDIKFDIVIGHLMKFCPVVPEICRGHVYVPKKERRRIII